MPKEGKRVLAWKSAALRRDANNGLTGKMKISGDNGSRLWPSSTSMLHRSIALSTLPPCDSCTVSLLRLVRGAQASAAAARALLHVLLSPRIAGAQGGADILEGGSAAARACYQRTRPLPG